MVVLPSDIEKPRVGHFGRGQHVHHPLHQSREPLGGHRARFDQPAGHAGRGRRGAQRLAEEPVGLKHHRPHAPAHKHHRGVGEPAKHRIAAQGKQAGEAQDQHEPEVVNEHRGDEKNRKGQPPAAAAVGCGRQVSRWFCRLFCQEAAIKRHQAGEVKHLKQRVEPRVTRVFNLPGRERHQQRGDQPRPRAEFLPEQGPAEPVRHRNQHHPEEGRGRPHRPLGEAQQCDHRRLHVDEGKGPGVDVSGGHPRHAVPHHPTHRDRLVALVHDQTQFAQAIKAQKSPDGHQTEQRRPDGPASRLGFAKVGWIWGSRHRVVYRRQSKENATRSTASLDAESPAQAAWSESPSYEPGCGSSDKPAKPDGV